MFGLKYRIVVALGGEHNLMPVDILFWLTIACATAPIVWIIVRPSKKKISWFVIMEAAVCVAFFVFYIMPIQRIKSLASGGDTNAQYYLACWYKSRFDYMWPNHEKTVYWLQRAASGGHAYAMEALAWHYEFGVGVGRDPEKAKALESEAKRLGILDAQSLREHANRERTKR